MNTDKNILIEAIEKYAKLSKKTRELEDDVSTFDGGKDDPLIAEYVLAVKNEDDQAKNVKQLAHRFFRDDIEKWLQFLGCTWSRSQGELSKEKTLEIIGDLLRKTHQ